MNLAQWFSRLGVAALLVAGAASAAEVQMMISAGFFGVYSQTIDASSSEGM